MYDIDIGTIHMVRAISVISSHIMQIKRVQIVHIAAPEAAQACPGSDMAGALLPVDLSG